MVVALAPEGVNRRKKIFASLSHESVVIKSAGFELPPCAAAITEIDFKLKKIRSQNWALAALVFLAQQNNVLSMDMLVDALKLKFKNEVFEKAKSVVEKITF